MKKILIWILGVLTLASIVQALRLGVGPAYYTLEYEPGIVNNLQFRLYNKDRVPVYVSAIVSGELAEYFKISNYSFKISAEQEYYPVNVEVKLPSGLSPGTYVTEVVFSARPSEGEGINAGVSVSAQIYTVVRSDKFLFAMINSSEREIALRVRNLGMSDIRDAYASLVLYDGDSEVFRINQSIGGVASGSEKTISRSRGNLSGEYLARVWLYYDGVERGYDSLIRIGKVRVVPIRVEVPGFKPGEINRIVVSYVSNWNRGVEFEPKIEVVNSKGSLISEIRANSLTIFKDADVEFFWDCSEIPEGRYTFKVYAFYDNVSEMREFRLSAMSGITYAESEDALRQKRLLTIVVFFVASIILIFVFRSAGLKTSIIKLRAKRAIREAELRNVERAVKIYQRLRMDYEKLSPSERKKVRELIMSAYETIKRQSRKKIELD
ncbi:MAG: hypothetical protein QXT20_02155 [Candidatus Woesearchaeota archaeon]